MTQSFPSSANTDPLGVVVLSHLVDRTNTLRANFTGTAEPSSPVANMLWADTTTGMLRVRNSANSAWLDVCPLGFQPKQVVPIQSAGALAAKELQIVVPHDATISRVLMVPDTATTGSVASTTEWTFALENVTQAVQLFSATPSTATNVAGVGGGTELVADAAYILTADQNASANASDVLRFTIASVGSPTAVADIAIAVELAPRGA